MFYIRDRRKIGVKPHAYAWKHTSIAQTKISFASANNSGRQDRHAGRTSRSLDITHTIKIAGVLLWAGRLTD